MASEEIRMLVSHAKDWAKDLSDGTWSAWTWEQARAVSVNLEALYRDEVLLLYVEERAISGYLSDLKGGLWPGWTQEQALQVKEKLDFLREHLETHGAHVIKQHGTG